jgi:hypothetical protein
LELLPCLLNEVIHLVVHSELVSSFAVSAFESPEEAMVGLSDIAGRIRGRQSAVLFTGPGRISPHCSELLKAIFPTIEVRSEVTSCHVYEIFGLAGKLGFERVRVLYTTTIHTCRSYACH